MKRIQYEEKRRKKRKKRRGEDTVVVVVVVVVVVAAPAAATAVVVRVRGGEKYEKNTHSLGSNNSDVFALLLPLDFQFVNAKFLCSRKRASNDDFSINNDKVSNVSSHFSNHKQMKSFELQITTSH